MREAPSDPDAYALLGDAYLQRVRETGDPTYYTRAEGSFDARSAARPEISPPPAARHPRPGPPRLPRRACARRAGRAGPPGVARPYGVLADAQIELGRYGAAARTLQRMVDLKPDSRPTPGSPTSASCTGTSAARSQAMRLAVSAGGGTRRERGYVQALLGKLEFDRGDYAGAEGAYREALARDPGFPAAAAGLARVEAARGDYSARDPPLPARGRSGCRCPST